jgi:hypothetical protein
MTALGLVLPTPPPEDGRKAARPSPVVVSTLVTAASSPSRPTPTASSAAPTRTPTPTPTAPAAEPKSAPAPPVPARFVIFERRDVSEGLGARRLAVRVELRRFPVTRAEIDSVARRLVEAHRGRDGRRSPSPSCTTGAKLRTGRCADTAGARAVTTRERNSRRVSRQASVAVRSAGGPAPVGRRIRDPVEVIYVLASFAARVNQVRIWW